MAEAVLSGMVPTALPVPVWVCRNNAATHRRLTDYLTGVQTDLMTAPPRFEASA